MIFTYTRASLLVSLLLIHALNTANGQLVNLFKSWHFYELEVTRADDIQAINFVQSFGYIVGGLGECSARQGTLDASYENIDDQNRFKLQSKVLIYSNHEATMSYVIQLEFSSFKITKNVNIEGFELAFRFNNEVNCIQILPINKDIFNIQNKYKLLIKDPKFLTDEKLNYIFHFGQVTVRTLIQCDAANAVFVNNKKLCADEKIKPETVEIGIENKDRHEITKYEPDLCEGHVMAQTCIIKYEHKTDTYFMLLQPLPDDFDLIIGDVDMTRLTDQQRELIEQGAQADKKSVKIGEFEYATNQTEGIMFVHHIEAFSRQKIPNGLVIKLIKYQNDYVNYIGLFKNPTKSNKCLNQNNNQTLCYCSKFKECRPCYYVSNEPIPFVPVNYGDNPVRISKPCRDIPFFKPFLNLEKAELALTLGNQNLSKAKQEYPSTVTSNSIGQFLSNREYLPKMCLGITYEKTSNLFHVKIIFNDFFKTAVSNIFDGTTYKFKLYSYNFKGRPNFYDGIYGTKSKYGISTKLLLSENTPIKLTDSIHLESLKPGSYLIEFSINQKSTNLCKANECVDESFYNNNFQCVPCSKMIVQFVLEHDMLVEEYDYNAHENDFHSKLQANKNKLTMSNDVRSKVIPASLFKSGNEIYKCSISNATLVNQHTARNMANDVSKLEVYSWTVPHNFNVSDIRLPYHSLNPKFYSVHSSNIVVKMLAVIFAILIFLIIVAFFAYHLRKLFRKMKVTKNVAFYLSININKEDQDLLKALITKYISVLKKSQKNMNIVIFDFSSKISSPIWSPKRLEEFDVIFYVCATESEILKLNDSVKVGRTYFEHDYNQLHYVDRFKNKCFDVTFNQNVLPINHDFKLDKEKRSIYNNSLNSPLLQNKPSYLKLPEQTDKLIEIIYRGTFYDNQNRIDDKLAKFGPCDLKSCFKSCFVNRPKEELRRSMVNVVRKFLRSNSSVLSLSHTQRYVEQLSDMEDMYADDSDIECSIEDSRQSTTNSNSSISNSINQ